MSINILVVDDHPMTVDGYISLLSENNFSHDTPNFIKSYHCKDAFNKINSYHKQVLNIDLAILDLSLPPYVQFNINDGFDLALFLRKKHPKCKIILLTMHCEALKVNTIIKKLVPEGFISKSDIDFELFPEMCKKILNGDILHSDTFIKSQRDLFKKNINWDHHDKQILVLISEGIKTVKLPNYIPLSMSAIEKRKASLKDQLLGKKGSDKDLIEKSKELGLL